MKMDNTYNLVDRFPIPSTWVLTVRKCECGQMLYWDTEKGEWHCMKESCKLYKTHLKERIIPPEKIERVLELGEILTIKEICGRLKMTERDVFKILRDNDIL